MKYKWIAVLLLCVLFCTACCESPAVTGDDTPLSSATTQTTKNTPFSRRIPFQTTEQYAKAVQKFHTVDDIDTLFHYNTESPITIVETDMQMFLEDRFFLVPSLEDSTAEIGLCNNGYTAVRSPVWDDCRYSHIEIFHHKNTASFQNEHYFRGVVTTADGRTFSHYNFSEDPTAEDAIDQYHLQVEGYLVIVEFAASDGLAHAKAHLETLTFEKVAIE